MLDTDIAIDTMAIAYHNLNGDSDKPVSPCGMCRQSLHEYEERTKHPMRLILSGMTGKVYIIERAGLLLPLSFGSENLKKVI
jgi:cytidine deaminase